MRVRNALWLAVLLIGCPLLRADCNDVVWDQQHVLSASDEQMLIQAAHPLVLAGASVHALTLDMGTASSLEAAVDAVQAACHSWQVPVGERKNNLLVFAVDTQRHKSGIFYGSLFHHALDSTWHDVAMQYMNPHFHDHEWAAGLAEGMRQTFVVLRGPRNTATDYTPLWHILGWLVIGVFAMLAGWFVSYWVRRRAEHQQQLSDAQADLQQAKNNATNDLDKAKQKLAEDAAIGSIATEQRQAILDRAYRTFSRIDAAESRGSSLAYIKSMADAYRAISESAQQCMVELPVRRVPRYDPPQPSVYSGARGARMAAESNSPAPASPATPASNTTVIHESSGGDGLLTGVLLGDMLGSRHDDEERESSREDRSSREVEEDDSPSISAGGGGDTDFSNDDDGGGGDTDTSSDDSGGGGDTGF